MRIEIQFSCKGSKFSHFLSFYGSKRNLLSQYWKLEKTNDESIGLLLSGNWCVNKTMKIALKTQMTAT